MAEPEATWVWDRDTAGLFGIGTVAAAVLLIDLQHAPARDAILEPAWTAAVYLALPLAAIVWLDIAKRPLAAVLAALGTLTVAAPVAARAWVMPRHWFVAHPLWILYPTLAGIAVLVAAARAGGARLGDWGMGLGNWRWWGPRFAALMGIIVPLVALGAVLSPRLLEIYPEYGPARQSLHGLALYQAGNGLYMAGWEFLFRAFLLFGVARYAGPRSAVLVQALPFFLLHSGKDEVEMAASFGGSLFLGWFCWRARCYWPAVFLHWSLNGVMEILGYFF